MENGRILAEVVRAWVGAELPGQPGVAARAAQVAAACYDDGSTVSDACAEAVRFVGSWVRHPSNWKAERDVLVALAS